MAYHDTKTSCPVRNKDFLVLSHTHQTCSAGSENEQLIDEIFYGQKMAFRIPMTRDKKVSF